MARHVPLATPREHLALGLMDLVEQGVHRRAIGAVLVGPRVESTAEHPRADVTLAAQMLDLAIRGGTLVTVEGQSRADLGIHAGRVAQIGGEMQAVRDLDATGLLVLPGGVDAHVHLAAQPSGWVDDFTSGSAAALAGGITTIGNMTQIGPDESLLTAIEREAADASRQTIADVFLRPILAEPRLDDIPRLPEAGISSIKIFLSSPGFDVNLPAYVEAMRLAGEHGLLSVLHCEDYAIIRDATARLAAAGRISLRYYPESRPVSAEVVATQRAAAISEATGAPVYIVHLSSRRALEVCVEAQARGVRVFVETRPMYVHLTCERFAQPDAGRYVGQPPLREQTDLEALWNGIRNGTISTVCTDHAPWSRAAKLDPGHTITALKPGVENLQVLRPMLYSEGVRTGRLSLERFVEVTSTNTARLFGLYPRKGTLAVGSDADVVLFDPARTRTIEPGMLESNARDSPYVGWQVTGWPKTTIRRGEIVYQDEAVVAPPGSGEILHCGQPRLD